MSSLQTEFEFTLPKGYVDRDGNLHRDGLMRLATARDEIEPMRDPRVAENEAYLTVILLSRVVARLGDVAQITPKTIEGLFAADLAYLQDFYSAINFGDPDALEAVAGASSAEPAQPELVTAVPPAGQTRGRARRAS
jgi:hypothetical protein